MHECQTCGKCSIIQAQNCIAHLDASHFSGPKVAAELSLLMAS